MVCNVAQGQTSADTVIPEFETIITDAEKAGKDPLEIARDKKVQNIWSFADFRRFSKYYGRKLAEEEAKLDKEAAERKVKEAQLDKELADKAGRLITIFSGLKKEGKFTQKEADILTRIYNSPAYSPETKKLIKERFPDLFPLK